jgi:hypothetical protein
MMTAIGVGRRFFSYRARPGVALVMTVVAMAVLGALVAGVFFTALRAQRDGRDAIYRVQALAAAEYGLATALTPAVWRSSWNTTARRGPLRDIVLSPSPETSDSVRIWKLGPDTFLLTSTGRAGHGATTAQRTISLLASLRSPRLRLRAAAIAMNGVAVADSGIISGVDTLPGGWRCPPGDDARPAAVAPSLALVDVSSCAEPHCLIGSPPASADSLAADAATYERFGPFSRDSLALAGRQLGADALLAPPWPSLDGGGECDAARLDNLGDPGATLGAGAPCNDYFPLVHASGNMRLQGGAGEGMLIVDGNLTIAGGATFSGVVAVRGVLEITELSELRGTALASRVIVHDGARVRYSSCAVERALRGAAEPVVPEGPAWSESY